MLKKVFIRGGLYLGNIVIVSISSSSAVIATEKCSVYNKINQMYWRFSAHNTMLAAKGEDDWIKDPEYYDSIINVIGKAIGDCMEQKNEFLCWDRQNLGKQTIIFKDTDHFDYTIENWNAVILYNAVNLVINDKDYWRYHDVAKPEEIIGESYERIRRYYEIEKTAGEEAKIVKKLKKLNKEAEDIMCRLTERYNNMNKIYERLKDSKDERKQIIAGYHMRDMTCIKQLQEALGRFNANSFNANISEDIEYFYEDALEKAEQAYEQKEWKIGNVSSHEHTINNNLYDKITYFLKQMKNNIKTLEMPKKLEQAKDDMIKYSKALHLGRILEEYVAYLPGSGYQMAVKESDYNLGRGKMFSKYGFKGLFYCKEPEQIDNMGNFPVWKNEVYKLYFIRARYLLGDETEKIYITGAKKFEYTFSQNAFYSKKIKEIGSYGYMSDEEYADVLKLLQGLVESLKGNERLVSPVVRFKF